jgi:NTE family protein
MIRSPSVDSSRFRIALVLAGGAARGAYEVGVVQYILEDIARELGRPLPIDILCGTSVGAINACFLAGAAEDEQRARRLARHWTRMRVAHVVRVDHGHVWQTFRGLLGRPTSGRRQGGLLDPAGLGRLVATAIPFGRISENLRQRRLEALTVSTTHVATGRTVVYIDRADGRAPRWNDPTTVTRPAEVTAAHALASAAIPFLFPPVQLDGEYHCDGGLRQNVPLSPARRLGASAMVVVSPKYESNDVAPDDLAVDREAEFPSPLFLLGKTLNALMLDRIDNDIIRLQRITSILEAGTRACGPDFATRLGRELGTTLRPIEAVLIRASTNISQLASDFVRAPAFASRASGMVGALLRRLGEARESDVLSYLLFDGEFARQLIEIGRADARARHDELCAVFARALA